MLDPRIEKYIHKRAMQKSRYLADKAMNCRNRQKYDKAIEVLEKILTLLPAEHKRCIWALEEIEKTKIYKEKERLNQ